MTGKTLKELNVKAGDVVSQLTSRGNRMIYYVMKGNHPYGGDGLWLCVDKGGDNKRSGWSSSTKNCTIVSRAKKYTAWQFTTAPENAETHTMPDGSIAWRVEVEPVVTEVMQKIGLHTGHTVVVKFNTIDGVPDCTSVKMECIE